MTREQLKKNIKAAYTSQRGKGGLRREFRGYCRELGMDEEQSSLFVFTAISEADRERYSADNVPEGDKDYWMREAGRLSAEGRLSKFQEMLGLECRIEDALGVWRQDADEIIHEGIRRYEMAYRMTDEDFARREKKARRIVEDAYAMGELTIITYRQRTIDYVMRELGVDVHRAETYTALVVQQLKQDERVAV